MTSQQDRIEVTLMQNRSLLVAIGLCLLKGVRDSQAKDLRRAILEVRPSCDVGVSAQTEHVPVENRPVGERVNSRPVQEPDNVTGTDENKQEQE